MKIHGTDRILSNRQSSARKQILPAENFFFFMLNAFQGMLCISVAGRQIVLLQALIQSLPQSGFLL